VQHWLQVRAHLVCHLIRGEPWEELIVLLGRLRYGAFDGIFSA
jgi:hypothetical protein